MIRSASRADGRKGGTSKRLWALLLAAVLLVSVAPAVRLWRGWTGAGESGPASSYRYRFQRVARGSVIRDLQSEIAFLQARIISTPDRGLDLAALAGAYLRMARATGDLSWYLLAEQAARRSLANLPFRNTGAVLILARVAEARHDFPGAIRLANKAGGQEEGLAIKVSSYLAMGRVDLAARVADRLVAQSPTLGSYTLRSLVRLARGQDDGATADLQRALAAEEPGETGASALARTYLGRLHYRRGRLDLAESLYHEALRILPQHPLALLSLAELELRRGRFRVAEQHFSQVVTISEASPNVYDHAVLRGLARVHELQEDREGAQRLWREAERRLRRDVTTGAFGHRRELARLLLERGRPENVPEALSLMQAEIRIRQDAETMDILAWALSRSDRWEEARQAMREALRWGVRDAAMFYRAGLIEQALGNPGGAQPLFRAAQATDPTFDAHARRVIGLGL